MFPWPELEGGSASARFGRPQILDSGPGPEFDAVVALVRDLFRVPICLISLMDTDRQWFKAKCGIEVEGTERSVAFCNYTIVGDSVFVVEDATADPRFSSNPLAVRRAAHQVLRRSPLDRQSGDRAW